MALLAASKVRGVYGTVSHGVIAFWGFSGQKAWVWRDKKGRGVLVFYMAFLEWLGGKPNRDRPSSALACMLGVLCCGHSIHRPSEQLGH